MEQGRFCPVLWGCEGVHRTRVIHLPFSSKPERLTVQKLRFFETTASCMLAILIQRYKVVPHPKFAGESFEQLKERYSQAKAVIALT